MSSSDALTFAVSVSYINAPCFCVSKLRCKVKVKRCSGDHGHVA